MIQNRVNAPEKGPAEGRETVRKKVVQRVAFVDTSNFYAPAFVSIVHMFLFELALEGLELLLEFGEVALKCSDAFLKWRAESSRQRIVAHLNRPAE